MSAPRSQSIARTPHRSDADLMARVAKRDVEALGELYDRYARDVWHAVRRTLGPDADVEDVVQALFIQLPDMAALYDGRASCRGWLCGIAFRLASRHRRGLGRFRRMLGRFAQTLGTTSRIDPERSASNSQELRAFDRALARLSEKKRIVMVLVELEGLTTEVVATMLEIPVATVRTRLFHARRDLHEAMRAEGIDP
jgi:RNA polymerase sigma-70 factor, ECF subfamily